MKNPKPIPNEITFPEGLSVREFVMTPASYKLEDHTVDAVLATETPARVWDWDRFEIVTEVLRMDGLKNAPAGTEIPLLDSHNRMRSMDQIGTTKIHRMENAQLIGQRNFSQANPNAVIIEGMVREGHLKAGSIGYKADKAEWVGEGKEKNIGGRIYSGPVKVVTAWRLLEDSTTPIGADPGAKVRSENTENKLEVLTMEKTKAALVALGAKADATDEQLEAFVRTLAVKPTAPPVPPVDEAKVRNEGSAEERARVTEIMELSTLAGHPEMARDYVEKGAKTSEVRKALCDLAAKDGKFGDKAAAGLPPKGEDGSAFGKMTDDELARALNGLSLVKG